MVTNGKYMGEHVANIKVGRDMNNKGESTTVKSPDGKNYRVVRHLKTDGSAEFFFFDMNGNVVENAPETLEAAYAQGWKKHDPEAGLERRKMVAETKKTEAEARLTEKGGMLPKEQRAHNAKRLKYVNDRMEYYVQLHPKATEEEKEIRRNIFAEEYDKEILGSSGGSRKIVKIKRNKKTGEIVYLDADNNVVKRIKNGQTYYTINQK